MNGPLTPETSALIDLWNHAVYVRDSLFSEGHYDESHTEEWCEGCEMYQEATGALDRSVEAVEALGFEPRGYGLRRIYWMGETAQAARALWDNPHEDTKCQAMAAITGDDEAIAELVQVFAGRWPEEATAFVANLERHRAETTLWGCRA